MCCVRASFVVWRREGKKENDGGGGGGVAPSSTNTTTSHVAPKHQSVRASFPSYAFFLRRPSPPLPPETAQLTQNTCAGEEGEEGDDDGGGGGGEPRIKHGREREWKGGGRARRRRRRATHQVRKPTDRPTEELGNGYAHELPPTPLPPQPPPPPAQQTIPGWKGGLPPKQIHHLHHQVRKRYLGHGGRGGGKGGSFLPGIWGRRSDGRRGRMERGREKKIPGAGEQLMWAVVDAYCLPTLA